MEMTSKGVRCSWCGIYMTLPSNVHSVQCVRCNKITRVEAVDPFDLAQEAISNASNGLHDLRDKTTGKIKSIFASNNAYASSSSTFSPRKIKPSWSLSPVSAHGRKRAVLCGVSYYGQSHRLNGTLNDVKCMRFFLMKIGGFPSDSILVLSEEESNPYWIPTKNNIRNAMKWLVQGCQSGDSLVFHFSGHGSQQQDYNGDEVDGYDEMLWPVDHHTAGTILDDEINATIVRPLTRGVKLHAIIDTCHSGTILDLQYVCKMKRGRFHTWEDHGRQSTAYKGTSGGLAISLSACDDHQVSVDTMAFSGNVSTGALTYSFIQAVENEPQLTYGRLINAMGETIRDAKTRYFPNGSMGSLLKNVMHKMLPQEPKLSSSEKFDVYSKRFTL